jgi:transitional endoplasmic reticulum ATPase
VVFFDELDSVAPRRSGGDTGDSRVGERVVSQLLTEMDGLEDLKGVVVIGATNRPDIVDEALLRPGRFDRMLEVPLPDNSARKEILKIHTVKKPLDKTVSLDKLVELTKGYSGADISAIVNAAAISAIRDHLGKEDRPTTSTSATSTIESAITKKPDEIKKEMPQLPLSISLKHFEAATKKIKRNVKTSSIGANLA